MPPARKRAAAAPKPEPDVDRAELEAPTAEDAPEGVAGAEPADAATPEPSVKVKTAKNIDLPCTNCFHDGWPDGVTARGCEHGSWTRN